ncbi:MAG TPA: iron-containing redox enzyme family protein [Kofleriaceae bacterium]|nr:iron-containing redox enzyme family protein [Kofleriaceae bacterium]
MSVEGTAALARLEEFWNIAGRARLQAQFAVASEMQLVERMPIESLREVLLQYRYFTLAFTTDIAAVIGRCMPSRLRSLLGELLHDELGQGDPEQAHPRLYDKFLISIGAIAATASESALHEQMHPVVRDLLADLSRRTRDASISYAIGLRGMGGECVCGVYFDELYKHVVHHAYVAEHRATIDWTFWDIHAGHHDVEHDTKTRAAVGDLARAGRLDIEQLAAGFEHGVQSWNRFWRTLYETHVAPAH